MTESHSPTTRVLIKRKRTQAPLDGLVMTDLTHPTKRICFYRLEKSSEDVEVDTDSCPMLDLPKDQSLTACLDEMSIGTEKKQGK